MDLFGKPVDPTRQTDGHDATRTPPAANLAPSYHLAAPSRRWRPGARTWASSGVRTAYQRGLVFRRWDSFLRAPGATSARRCWAVSRAIWCAEKQPASCTKEPAA